MLPKVPQSSRPESLPVTPSPWVCSKEAAKKGVGIIGPATVGGMMPGRFRIGNAGGAVELLGMIQKLDVEDTLW